MHFKVWEKPFSGHKKTQNNGFCNVLLSCCLIVLLWSIGGSSQNLEKSQTLLSMFLSKCVIMLLRNIKKHKNKQKQSNNKSSILPLPKTHFFFFFFSVVLLYFSLLNQADLILYELFLCLYYLRLCSHQTSQAKWT